MTTPQTAKWFDSLPAPISAPAQMSAEELHDLLQSPAKSQVIIVDVRRADIEVSPSCAYYRFVLTYQGRSSMYDPKRDKPSRSNISSDSSQSDTYAQAVCLVVSEQADGRYKQVVFHCSSSNGRGPRCAAWYEDALNERGIKNNAHVLSGGIKKWLELYPDEVVRI
jgi:arsenical-resistance protein 2